MVSDRLLLPNILRIAAIEVLAAGCVRTTASSELACRVEFRCLGGEIEVVEAHHDDRLTCIAQAISQLCSRPIAILRVKVLRSANDTWQVSVAVGVIAKTPRSDEILARSAPVTAGAESISQRKGAGRYVASDEATGIVVATLRAANHAGLLKPAYRANYQKFLREWASEAGCELSNIARDVDTDSDLRELEVEGLLLEYFNRVASAAVVTAVNNPRPDSILSLFDSSAWLYDERGQRRDAYTDTTLWLAWYPGVENNALDVDDVIASMPASPETAIPWMVRLFENPTSWLRFRGAIDLEDHDILHVLLGRGLQDQDEAFVLGFAMGTAKRVSWLQYWGFRWIVTRLYPEPYRIPAFLLPAFDLGLKCGRETGAKNLYRQQLKRLRSLSVGQARSEAGIDMAIVRRYYEQEQQCIPYTIASLRLP